MPFHTVNGLRFFSFASFDRYGITNAIFTRHGGVSEKPWDSLNTGGTVGDDPIAVRENVQRMFHAVNRVFGSRYDGWQVHGDTVMRVDNPRPEYQSHMKTDGLITDKPDVTLLMRFADCVPVLLYDPRNKAVGIVHAGWKGTVLQIAAKAVRRMQEGYGSRPSEVVAGIGPSIGPADYQVGEEVVAAARDSFGSSAESILIPMNSGYHFDLWQANRISLETVGVREIEIAGISTFSGVNDWFSHRKENGKTGRFGAVIALPGEGV